MSKALYITINLVSIIIKKWLIEMDKDQLLEVIENGETQEVEFKQSFHSSQDFSKNHHVHGFLGSF